jgi:hypothetical protein
VTTTTRFDIALFTGAAGARRSPAAFNRVAVLNSNELAPAGAHLASVQGVTLTFTVIALFAGALMLVGVLLTRFVRWRPVFDATQDNRPIATVQRHTVGVVVSVFLITAVVIALLWFWGLVGLPH